MKKFCLFGHIFIFSPDILSTVKFPHFVSAVHVQDVPKTIWSLCALGQDHQCVNVHLVVYRVVGDGEGPALVLAASHLYLPGC